MVTYTKEGFVLLTRNSKITSYWHCQIFHQGSRLFFKLSFCSIILAFILMVVTSWFQDVRHSSRHRNHVQKKKNSGQVEGSIPFTSRRHCNLLGQKKTCHSYVQKRLRKLVFTWDYAHYRHKQHHVSFSTEEGRHIYFGYAVNSLSDRYEIKDHKLCQWMRTGDEQIHLRCLEDRKGRSWWLAVRNERYLSDASEWVKGDATIEGENATC